MTGTQDTFVIGPDDTPDKYRLLQHVGGGGEAQLWQAELAVAGGVEQVAVKILRPDRMGDLERLSLRWADQAELLRFVGSPGVVGVREHFEGVPFHRPGSAPGTPGRSLYLVMNWVDGSPLHEWLMINRDPIVRVPRVLRHLEQAATVLDWLHSGAATPSRRAIVHGDLSPGNIMITPAGQAMLVDFGLVRAATHQTAEAAGTPGYAAPEVWTDGTYSPASDRYSFGAIGYYALTGATPPVDSAAIRAGLAAHPLVSAAPAAFLDQLMSIFSERPADRPPAMDWVRLLRNTATTTQHGAAPVPPAPPMPSTPVPAGRTRRITHLLGWAAAAVVVVLTAGVVIGATLIPGAVGDEPGAAAGGPETSAVQTVPTDDPSSDAEPSSAAGAAAPQVPSDLSEVTVRRASGDRPLSFAPRYDVDLDSLAQDWSINDPSAEKDIENFASGSYLGGDFSPVTGTADIAECVRATVYISQIELEQIDPGASYCVRTSGGRFAWMTVLDAAQPVTLDITVWDPPLG